MKTSQTQIAILGAGLTGMSAALELQRQGVDYRLIERLAHPGGHAITTEDSGFRFDRTGHLLHLRNDAMRPRVLEWIGDDYVEVQRRSVIFSHGVYTRYPFQANTFGLPPKIAAECLLGFIQAHHTDHQRPPANFEEFCRMQFGDGISDHFMIPYNSRLWGVAPSEITAAWCQRFVPKPKLEDVVAGAVGLNDRELGYNTHFVYPRLGIGELPKAMATRVKHLELERRVRSIDTQRRRLNFDDESIEYDQLITSAPLDSLLRLCSGLPDDVQAAGKRLRCTHLYYLDVALKRPCGQDVHWVYVPEAKYPFYRVGCYSNFSAAMAPPGKSCLYVELADRAPPDLEELLPRVASGLTDLRIIDRPADIEFARLRRIDHAYVVFDHDYYDAVELIHPALKERNIISTGRYGGWNYSSMEDALLFGVDAAREATGSDARSA